MSDSLYSLDKLNIFRDGLSSEQNTRMLGGTPSNITYSVDKATFNGSSSKIVYRNVSGIKSVRIILTPSTTTQNILKLSSTHSISVSAGTVSATGFSSPTIYVNGVAGSTITAAKVEIIITTATAIRGTDIQLGYISSYLTGSVELLEFYKDALSANECLNLYENKRHRELNFNTGGRKLILDVNAFSGVVRNTLSGNAYNELFTNSGIDTDWIDSNSDGLADNWTEYSLNGTNTIITGNGFTGNAQRVEYDGSSTYAGIEQYTLTSGKSYKVSFKYRCSSGFRVNDTITLHGTYTTNIGNPIQTSLTFIAGSNTKLAFTLNDNTGWFEIDEVSLKEVIPSVVNTAVTVVKENDVYAMRFNGTTSKIDCGSYDTLVGDKTFIVWVNFSSLGENIVVTHSYNSFLLDNGKTILSWMRLNNSLTDHRPSLTSDNASVTYGNNGYSFFKKFTNIIVTRSSTGVTNFYVNGVLSGTANQSSGTPVAGTNNIIIGNKNDGSRCTNGLIPSVRIIDGLLTAQEINQLYSTEVGRYT